MMCPKLTKFVCATILVFAAVSARAVSPRDTSKLAMAPREQHSLAAAPWDSDIHRLGETPPRGRLIIGCVPDRCTLQDRKELQAAKKRLRGDPASATVLIISGLESPEEDVVHLPYPKTPLCPPDGCTVEGVDRFNDGFETNTLPSWLFPILGRIGRIKLNFGFEAEAKNPFGWAEDGA